MASVDDKSHDTSVVHSKLKILTLNDVYRLYPKASGQGGMAEMGALLRQTRASAHPTANTFTTLNGDFLWQSALDRRDKGEVMIDVLNAWEIDYVVLGNHEFDYGAGTAEKLLSPSAMNFTCFGSNVRYAGGDRDKELFSPVTDTSVYTTSEDIRVGLFGLVTRETGDDPYAGDSVVFEKEVVHAKRCVEHLYEVQSVDVIIALTHLDLKDDRKVARKVPGIHLILGGHDHTPMTMTEGMTVIHKSGQDALWLGIFDLDITRNILSGVVHVDYQWQMISNRGFDPDDKVASILQKYSNRIYEEDKAAGKLEHLATINSTLDGTRLSCRTRETNLGKLAADALRWQMDSDIGLVNAAHIKCDELFEGPIQVTMRWLQNIFPLEHSVIKLSLPASLLKAALTFALRNVPAMHSAFPHLSGLVIHYNTSKKQLTSCRLDKSTEELDDNQLVTVALPYRQSWSVWKKFFSRGQEISQDKMIREAIASYIQQMDAPIVLPTSHERMFIHD